MTNEKVDVVIVGAGASGSLYASVLAKAGKKVVLLESGPDWELSDLISSEIWGRRIKPAGAPIVLEGKNPMAYAAQGGWGVGGAALHYYANFPRLLPTDFRTKSEHNRAHDWPIAYEDVAPFYDKVAREIGVSGDANKKKFEDAIAPYVARARATLPDIKQRFNKGLKKREVLFVTIRLHGPDNKFEQVYVEVKAWKDTMISGLLSSEPTLVKGHQQGEKMVVDEKDVYDWTLSKPDGTEEGNFVGNFLDTYHP